MEGVEFRHVSFGRGTQTRILDDVTLTISASETVVLVGPSGAGKTTILKLVNRLLVPEAGAVYVQGQDTRDWNPISLRRRVGYVIQEVGLFPHMRVSDNVAVVPRLDRWADDRIAARVNELLELVGLPPAEYADRWPDELSGGQQQRVGVARALAADPPILLMDEPFGALDPITRRQLRNEFRRIQARLRKCVMLVTHDMTEAMALGDRIGVIERGRLIWCGTPQQIAVSTDPYVRGLVDAATVPPSGARNTA
jgi:osmoprotectant transport system ATP-binding protein